VADNKNEETCAMIFTCPLLCPHSPARADCLHALTWFRLLHARLWLRQLFACPAPGLAI